MIQPYLYLLVIENKIAKDNFEKIIKKQNKKTMRRNRSNPQYFKEKNYKLNSQSAQY